MPMQTPPNHVGSMSTPALVEWAMSEGASPGAARALARTRVAGHAGRLVDAQPSSRLLARAGERFRDDALLATPVLDADGTVRFAVALHDGVRVETVVIAHGSRTTVCLSTQAGCARACVFCETGRLGLVRQLDAWEITGQLRAAARWLAGAGRAAPSNVVFMGMGEPLDNLDAVLTAAAVLSDDNGFAIAERRITVSTVGVVPKMYALFARSKLRLALSLHAANDADRRALLPVARTWDLAALRAAVAASPRTVLVQWTLIAGKNDGAQHARELLAFCDGLDVRINLIPLNPGPDDSLRSPSLAEVRAFQARLADAGARVMVRLPHGQAIGGACGQLAGALRGAARGSARLPIAGRAPTFVVVGGEHTTQRTPEPPAAD